MKELLTKVGFIVLSLLGLIHATGSPPFSGDVKKWIDVAYEYYKEDKNGPVYVDWYHSAETFVEYFTEEFAAKADPKTGKNILVAGVGLSEIPVELMRQNCKLLHGGKLVAADFNHFGLWMAAKNFVGEAGKKIVKEKSNKEGASLDAAGNQEKDVELTIEFKEIFYAKGEAHGSISVGKEGAKYLTVDEHGTTSETNAKREDIVKANETVTGDTIINFFGENGDYNVAAQTKNLFKPGRQFHGFRAEVGGRCDTIKEDVKFELVYVYRDFVQAVPKPYGIKMTENAAQVLKKLDWSEWNKQFDYILDKGLLDSVATGRSKGGEAAKNDVQKTLESYGELLKPKEGSILWTSHSGNRLSGEDENFGNLYKQIKNAGGLTVEKCNVLQGHGIPPNYWSGPNNANTGTVTTGTVLEALTSRMMYWLKEVKARAKSDLQQHVVPVCGIDEGMKSLKRYFAKTTDNSIRSAAIWEGDSYGEFERSIRDDGTLREVIRKEITLAKSAASGAGNASSHTDRSNDLDKYEFHPPHFVYVMTVQQNP